MALRIALLLCFTACTTQHYRVVKVSPTKFENAKISVEALEGRLNGYSVEIKNTNKTPIHVDWSKVQIKQEDGYEVPTKVNTMDNVQRIHTNNKVKYHIEPTSHYQIQKRQGQPFHKVFWRDFFKLWPDNKQVLYIPYTVKGETANAEVESEFVLEITQRAQRSYQAQQETFSWFGHTYDTPVKLKGFTLKLRGGITNLTLYNTETTSSFGFEAGYQLYDFELSVGYRGLSNFVNNNINQDSSETSLFVGYDVFHLWLLTTKIFGQLNYLSSSLEQTNETTTNLLWDQGNLMVGGGLDLGLNLSENISIGLKSGFSRGIYLSIEDEKLAQLQNEAVYQLNSLVSQFDGYIEYTF